MDAQWLKNQLQQFPQKSKADLARALGLEPPAVSKILSGGRQIKAQEYVAMRRFFGLPVDGEKAAKGGVHTYVLKPLEDEALREGGEANEAGDWALPAALIAPHTGAAPEQIRIFTAQDHFMEPDFRKGEHVLVDLSDALPSPPGAFIVSDGFGHMVRLCAYAPMSNPPRIQVSARSASFAPQELAPEEFRIVGRVIAKLQWL